MEPIDGNDKIGSLMVQQGVITQDQLNIALTEQKKNHQPIKKILVTMGFVSEAVMRDFLSRSYRQTSVDLSKIVVDGDALALVPKELARKNHLLPLHLDVENNTLSVAMSDVFNVLAIDNLKAHLQGKINVLAVLAGEAEIISAIDTMYGFDLSLDGILHELETGEIDYQSIANQDQYSQPVVRLVDALLADAVKRSASDIHFEPEHGFLRVRYRIDGVLQQIRSLHYTYWSAIAVRLKVMAGMNIAETRIAQDGRISLNLSGRPIDFRVSVLPTIYGENIVLRILDRQKGILSLNQLGLREQPMHLLQLMVARPEGVILVTGPTGSGKTTTLYSLLNYLNTEAVNIMTLEDPVEYHLGMIRQTATNEAVKLDFASGVRAMLRQDPDIVLIGEIRDQETADMAFRAAMTGHQVFSTLHTNSSIGAIARLQDLGVTPDILVDNIIGIIGQRLVRRLCPHCKKIMALSEIERKLMNLSSQQNTPIYHPVGCTQCAQRGYKGRLSLMEVLRMQPQLEELIATHANVFQLKQKAQELGFETLAEDGIRRVLEGETSLDEISRVVNLTDRLQ